MQHGPCALDRRSFLRDCAGGATAIAIASLLPAGCANDYPQAASDVAPLQALSEKEYAVARAVAEAFLVGAPVDPATVARAIDAELAMAGDPMLSDMKTVFGLIEHATFLGGRFRRFTALSSEQRLRDLQGWSQSRFSLRRAAFQAAKGFVTYFAYIREETRPHTGFTGPWPESLKLEVRPVDFGEVA
jgi:hypothetical protein